MSPRAYPVEYPVRRNDVEKSPRRSNIGVLRGRPRCDGDKPREAMERTASLMSDNKQKLAQQKTAFVMLIVKKRKMSFVREGLETTPQKTCTEELILVAHD